LVTALPRHSLKTGLDTERNLANDVMSTGNLFSIGDIPKQKKMKREELSVLILCLKQCKQSRELLVQHF